MAFQEEAKKFGNSSLNMNNWGWETSPAQPPGLSTGTPSPSFGMLPQPASFASTGVSSLKNMGGFNINNPSKGFSFPSMSTGGFTPGSGFDTAAATANVNTAYGTTATPYQAGVMQGFGNQNVLDMPQLQSTGPGSMSAYGRAGDFRDPGVSAADQALMDKATTDANAGGFDLAGEWTNVAGFGLGVLNTGVSIWNAYEQSKMNAFMKDYYGQQMDMQTTDFSNAATDYNHKLKGDLAVTASADYNPEQSAKIVDAQMKEWQAETTFG